MRDCFEHVVFELLSVCEIGDPAYGIRARARKEKVTSKQITVKRDVKIQLQ